MRLLFILLIVGISLFAFLIYCPPCIYVIVGYFALAVAWVVDLFAVEGCGWVWNCIR